MCCCRGCQLPILCSPSAVAVEMGSLRPWFLFPLSLLAWLSCQWQRETRDSHLPLLTCEMIRNLFILKGVWLFSKLLSIFTLLLNSFLIYYCFYCPFLSVSKDQRCWKHLPRKAPWEVLHPQNSHQCIVPFLKYKAEGNWKHLKGALLYKAFVCLKTSFCKLPLEPLPGTGLVWGKIRSQVDQEKWNSLLNCSSGLSLPEHVSKRCVYNQKLQILDSIYFSGAVSCPHFEMRSGRSHFKKALKPGREFAVAQ